MIYLSLLLSFFLYTDVQWQEYVHRYNQTYTEDHPPSPEAVWATGLLYYSSSEDLQEEIADYVHSETLRNELKINSSFQDFISAANRHLYHESLLLLRLLLEDDRTVRNSLFDAFYAENDLRYLYKINLFAKDGEKISSEELDTDNFEFHHFLIAFYESDNYIASDEFFRHFAGNWEKWINQSPPDDMTEDLLYATILRSLYEFGSYQDILRLHERLNNISYIPPSRLKRNLFWNLDFAMYRLGEIDKSLEIQRNFTIPISEYIDDKEGLHAIYTTMGGYLYILGMYQDAREVFLSTLEWANQLSDTDLTRLYNNLSLVYFKTGEASRYVETQLKALELAERLNNYSHQVQVYRNLHIFYRKNRNWNLAARYIEEAAQLTEETGNQSDLISIYISQAVFEDQSLENRPEAYQKLDLAESLFSEDTEPRIMIRVLDERSRLYTKDRRWHESKTLQEKIRDLAAGQSDSPVYLTALIRLAQIHVHLGQIEKTRRLLQKFRAHDITVVDFPTLVLAQTLQARVAIGEERFNKAEELFASVTDLVLERARNTSELETGYWSVEPEYLRLFEEYTDFLISHNRPEEALALLDRVKTINDASLFENPLITSTMLSEEDLATERQITQQMDRLRKEMFAASGQERLSLQQQLEALSAQKQNLIGTPDILYNDRLPPLWSIQNRLKSNQMILHITAIGNSYYLSHIYRNSVNVTRLEVTQDHVELFEEAIESIMNGRTDLELLYRIGQLLDLPSLSNRIRSLVIIPDGYFHQLPLDVIPLQPPDSPVSYGSAYYLIEAMDIRVLNSLGDLHQRPIRTHYEYDYIGFGVSEFRHSSLSRSLAPLPQATEEVRNIYSTLQRMDIKTTFTANQATLQTFREKAGKSKILHLATHSEISESDPLFSRLYFFADPDTNTNEVTAGQLFAYELFDLDLQNQLIMLNSCESGADKFLQGSGIMGISRALRYAGAQSLVLNSWPVNDQFAADFADKFYENLNRGHSKSRALQLTKIWFMQEKNANPHYWGSYILNGDNRPVLRKTETDILFVALPLIFFAGFILAWRRREEQGSAMP